MKSQTAGAWREASRRGHQTGAAVLGVVVGATLVIGFRDLDGSGLSGPRAGFLLGVLLLGIGIATLVFAGGQSITIDPAAESITIEQAGRFRNSTRRIRFDEIAELRLGELGDNEGGSITYYVAAELTSGDEVALFFPFYDGTFRRSAMEARRDRLAQFLRASD